MSQVGGFFGGIGVMVEQGLKNIKIIDGLMGEYIEAYWKKFGPMVSDFRKHHGPKVALQIEYLHQSIVQYDQQQSTRK